MQKLKRVLIPLLLVRILVTTIPELPAQTVYGFAGKPYNPVTGLYDFGYRDYHPETGRFTTEDPVRDTLNWYSYAAQDPVNFVDPLGLSNVSVISYARMQIGSWAKKKLTGSNILIEKEGCFVTTTSNEIQRLGIEYNPAQVNLLYVTNGDLNWENLSKGEGLEINRIKTNYTTAEWNAQGKDDLNVIVTGIVVPLTLTDEVVTHLVGVYDVCTIDEKNYFVVSPSSVYDCADSITANRLSDGWIKKGDLVLVPESLVSGSVVIKKPKSY